MQIISRRPVAVARIRGGRDAFGLSGTVRFYQFPGAVLVEADISGLPDNGSGFYGFHIHEGFACAGEGFSATGGHFNPTNMPHPYHAGDLPPLLAHNGRAYLAVMTDRFSLRDIMGRTVVVHGMPDDFQTQPAGNSGEKIGCGVIQRVCSSASNAR